MMFKSKFLGWDDIVPVDFTRTSESVQRVPDLKVCFFISLMTFSRIAFGF